MSFDPRDFLEVARALSNSRHSEKEWRTAGGRAYYALYLMTVSAVQVDQEQGEGVHHAAERALRDHNHLYAHAYRKLRILRLTCDYHPESTVTLRQAMEQVLVADLLLHDMQADGLLS
jgi:hypothetical protein